MKKLLTTGFCLLFGLSLVAGCGGGGGSAFQSPTSPPPSPPHSPSSALTLVNPLPVVPQGNVGQPYSSFTSLYNWVQGGVPIITFSLKSGTLPAGLTLNSDGTFGGIPTVVSASTVVVTATDSGKPPSSVNFSISITINPMLPLTLGSGGALPDGTVGALYHFVCHGRGGCSSGAFITAAGGVIPYLPLSWSALPGSSLPSGLGLFGNGCPLQCSGGLISGIPTTAGIYNFVVTATDSESPPKQVSANYTITVAPPPSPSPSSSP